MYVSRETYFIEVCSSKSYEINETTDHGFTDSRMRYRTPSIVVEKPMSLRHKSNARHSFLGKIAWRTRFSKPFFKESALLFMVISSKLTQ